MFEELHFPVLVAPMAGGPTTPELVAAVVEAGGSGFVAAGYLGADALAERIARTRELTKGSFGVNLFVPGARSTMDLSDYVARIEAEARRYGAEPGEPRWDDDGYSVKLDLVVEQRLPFVSFTFGLPSAEDVARLHEAGSRVITTVTSPGEAVRAAEVGADALCVQGFEAGAHRGLFTDDPADPAGGGSYGLLALLRLVSAEVDLPLIATGGLVHGADVAAVLTAGAVAAQLGTAFLRADEAGTQPAHQKALAEGGRETAFTRAFSGRTARGMVNRFLSENSPVAPAAYPQVHHLTRPVRAAAGKAGDPEGINLWAGQTYPLATAGPAAQIFARVREEALAAVGRVKLG
ncbi:nitronate monooxygenase [Amycolatopsis acidiphila]|uniref:Propionate 3-nitronate monooxygenase n=1 Tax=Amycolatopsis acidiphila TaxID=715473 RepID=A0A558A607_9PSEU|nr:nitronate monooxygenase [Amycolatopsis acidiphila]TVT19690.1 nitronate monooxygenase [Amycolatopsis acidiphila]UIJ61791.1 nitronate monooxygenase [Amycolatopsis acidiphila]GHG57913.1 2-nitropropane dioxygenase [Amycolatopsis acidiphila]